MGNINVTEYRDIFLEKFIGYIIGIIIKYVVDKNIILKDQRASVLRSAILIGLMPKAFLQCEPKTRRICISHIRVTMEEFENPHFFGWI